MIFNFFNPWKIQLTIVINFISSKDAEKSVKGTQENENIKFTSLLMQMKLLMNYLSHFVQYITEI